MPIYEYGGQHYELPDGLSNEQAIGKIKSHLGQSPKAPEVAPEKKKTSWKEDASIGLAGALNTIDAWGTGVLRAPFSKDPNKEYEDLEWRKRGRQEWANPEGKEQTTGGKIAGAVSTLPLQMLAMPFSPAETGQTMLDKGESLPRAMAGSVIDTAGNVAGMALPGSVGLTMPAKVVSGAGINAAQDVATRAAISGVAQNEATKQSLGPSVENALISGVIGGGIGAAHGLKGQTKEVTIPKELPAPLENTKTPSSLNPSELKVQQDLPFISSVEDIAAKKAEASPQRDMFVEMEQSKTPGEHANVDVVNVQNDVKGQAGQVPQDKFQIPKSQRGAINTEVFKEGFWKSKTLPNDIRLSIEGEGSYARVRAEKPVKSFDGHDEYQTIGIADINPEGEFAQPKWVKVNKAEQGQGLAREMYNFFAEQGNDIIPDNVQSTDGQALWESLANKSIAAVSDNGYIIPGSKTNSIPPAVNRFAINNLGLVPQIPKSQRGAIDVQSIYDGIRNVVSTKPKIIEDVLGQPNLIPKDPDIGRAKQDSLKHGKDAGGVISNNLGGGSTLEAMNRRSPLILAGSRIIQNARKRAELYIRQTVYPVEQMIRNLPDNQLVQLAGVFKTEMLEKATYSVEQLEHMGLNIKQMAAYAGIRKMFDNTLAVQNKARTKQGLDPITGQEFYLSSRWKGDFRQPVYDAEGRLKWYLAADSKLGLNKQIKALKEKFPDLVVDSSKQHVKKSFGNKNDLQAQYTTLLDLLGRDDPAVQAIQKMFEDTVAADASTTLGQLKHFERKVNVRGFVGDRPGTKAHKEAQALFQEQAQYAKNAYQWAAMQEAGSKIKELISDPELQKQQPNNIEYLKQYYKDNLGQNTAGWVRGIEDAVRATGVSPQVFNKAVGGAKSFFITQKLAASAGYSIANMLQTANVLPHLMDIRKKYGGNPVTALPMGVAEGMLMATSHYASYMGKDMMKNLPEFQKQAFKYAEDNGITSRSIYDESPITMPRGATGKAIAAAQLTMSAPETVVRSMAFMTYAEMLRSTKKFKTSELFQKAEELTNASMVDYRSGERPMIFSKLGTMGNALNTLQTYPVNFYNQWRYFATEAARGNIGPLVAASGVAYAMGGIYGLPGVGDFDKLIAFLKENAPDNVWAKVKDFDLKLWALENLGESAAYGMVSDKSGVSMQSRLTSPNASDMVQSPLAPAQDIGKQVGSVANALISPNETTGAQALYNVTPTGLQGLVETKLLRDQLSTPRSDGTRLYKKTTDMEQRKGLYARTPEEERIRSFGLRSQREAMTKDLDYRLSEIERQGRHRSKGIVEKFYDATQRGDTAKARELARLYAEINGTEINQQAIKRQILEEKLTSLERRTTSGKKNIQNLIDIARIKKQLEVHDNGN